MNTIKELNAMRKDIDDLQRLAIDITEMVSRFEHNQHKMKDDLEATFKTAASDALADIQTALAKWERLERLIKEKGK